MKSVQKIINSKNNQTKLKNFKRFLALTTSYLSKTFMFLSIPLSIVEIFITTIRHENYFQIHFIKSYFQNLSGFLTISNTEGHWMMSKLVYISDIVYGFFGSAYSVFFIFAAFLPRFALHFTFFYYLLSNSNEGLVKFFVPIEKITLLKENHIPEISFILLLIIVTIKIYKKKYQKWSRLWIVHNIALGIYKVTRFSAKTLYTLIVSVYKNLHYIYIRIKGDMNKDTIQQKNSSNTTGANLSTLKNTKQITNRQNTHDIQQNHTLLPPITFLRKNDGSMEFKHDESKLLLSVLNEFGVSGDILSVNYGPVVTLYEFKPSAGTKSSRVIGLSDDIARSISSTSARISVIPGKNALGIEIPNKKRTSVYMRDLVENFNHELTIPLGLGYDISGAAVVVDLAKMPHLLVAGTTGSGKSVSINSMIVSLLYKFTPEECKFIMIDPKMLELSIYQGIPHLLSPVITEPKKAISALKWAVQEMEKRYRIMAQFNVRNLQSYNEVISTTPSITKKIAVGFDEESGEQIFENQTIQGAKLPFIVIIIDEMADLMMVAGKEVEIAVQRLAQMARASGIHLIMATQRPSVDVITGTIKANFPTRVSFQMSSSFDSKTILGERGAEQLLGSGDMLYMSSGGKIRRLHGPFISDSEIENVVNFLKSHFSTRYVVEFNEDFEVETSILDSGGSKDPLYNQAVEIVRNDGKVSTSYIQRRLEIGYNRAAKIVETMEENGIVSKPNRLGRRDIL